MSLAQVRRGMWNQGNWRKLQHIGVPKEAGVR